jgi:hypothetical protein
MISLENAEHLVKHQFKNKVQADVEYLFRLPRTDL